VSARRINQTGTLGRFLGLPATTPLGKAQLRQRVYGISTAIAVVAFVGSGLANLFHSQHVASDMARLGYPPYFMTVLGAWKVLGAIAIAAPRLSRAKEWAYAGMVFDLTGAAASRIAVGDGIGAVLAPLAVAAVVAVSWASRPPARILVGQPGARGLAARVEVA
jgi:uncharacterized membrane protein YphA (DoxX/SURF4 family)